ncbi:MAG TPA: GerMN domain-containing protein [Ktedonobacterales bacterium]|nr:GerMN domain-containing protein [Ktedonobacterales bacterium]
MSRRTISRSVPQAVVVVLSLLATLLVAACGGSSPSAQPTNTPGGLTTATTKPQPNPTATATSPSGPYPVLVYFSRHPDSDNDPTKVFSVQRQSPTLGVATYAINQLIAGPTAAEQAQGLYTPLTESLSGTSNCGSADFKITLDHRGSKAETGTATLQFCRTTSLAGDLTGPRIKAEITKTLTQFSNIKQVVILNKDGECFDDLSGQNNCLK